MLIKIIEVTKIPNVFFAETKEELIKSCVEDAKKNPLWNHSSELTIILETFGEDMDEIYAESKFTK